MANINISWIGNPTGIFEVQYATLTGNWTELSNSPVTGLSTTLSGLLDNTSYRFRVRSTSCGNWVYYNFNTPTVGCTPPTSVVVTNITSSTAIVNWVASASAINGYRVEYQLLGSGSWNSVPVSVGITTANIAGLIDGNTYTFRVVSICANNGTSTSPTVDITTPLITTQCSTSVSTTSSVIPNISDYSITWSNVGNPSQIRIEVGLSNSSFNELVNITAQSLTNATYSLPLITNFPETHFVRLTPVCPDGSTGVSTIYNYVKPVVIGNNITVSNQSSKEIDFVAINGTPIQPGTNIAPSSSQVLRNPILTNNPIILSAKFAAPVVNGTYFKISNTRSSVTTAFPFSPSINNEVILSDGFVYQNGDILTIENDPLLKISMIITADCVGGNCTQQGGFRLLINLDTPLLSTTTFSFAFGYSYSGVPNLIGSGIFNTIPSGWTIDPWCNVGFNITIPSGVTSFTSPLLTCSGNPLLNAPCQPCATPLTHVWIKPIASPNLVLSASGINSFNNQFVATQVI